MTPKEGRLIASAAVAFYGLFTSCVLCATAGDGLRKVQAPQPLLSKDAGAWVIELHTSGGYTGRGGRSGVISSAGQVQAARTPMPILSCSVKVTAQELSPLRTGVSGARPEQWRASYAPSGDDGCCDRFNYTLTLQQRGGDGTVRTNSTSWYDGNERLIPGDLKALLDAADLVWTKALARCQE